MKLLNKIGLNNNQLKIIAMVAMTLDHAGKELFPQIDILPIIGRLAFPIFAFMIAEGCMYTKNKRKYFLQIFFLAVGCQLVYFIAMHSFYQNVLITFTLAILIIFSIENFIKKKNAISVLPVFLSVTLAVFLCFFAENYIKGFHIDYGFFGVLLPVAVYFAKGRIMKLCALAVCLCALTFSLGSVQWYAFAVIPLLALYNGKRGKLKLKYIFYIFYPAHLAIIHILSIIMD